MPDFLNNHTFKVSSGWGKLVEKNRKNGEQTLSLITYSTTSLLDISQTTTLTRFLGSVNTQVGWFFTQSFFKNFYLLGGRFYSLSPNLINTNEFKKGFVL